MVPSTFTGLLLFIVLLAPGLCFYIAWERRRPSRDLSALKETGAVVLVSLVVAAAVALIYAFLREVRPQAVPNLPLLMLGSDEERALYAAAHFTELILWSIGALTLACMCGYALGALTARRAGSEPSRAGIKYVSNWWDVFRDIPASEDFQDCRVYVGCELDDGSRVEGYLYAFTPDIEETGDREITLVAPLKRRPPLGTDDSERDVEARAATFFVLSARRIVSMEVSYVSRQVSDAAGGHN